MRVENRTEGVKRFADVLMPPHQYLREERPTKVRWPSAYPQVYPFYLNTARAVAQKIKKNRIDKGSAKMII